MEKQADDQSIACEPERILRGVDRAIEIVERALAMYGAPIYVRHEVVHNRFVVEDLEKKERCSWRISRKYRKGVCSFSVRMVFLMR